MVARCEGRIRKEKKREDMRLGGCGCLEGTGYEAWCVICNIERGIKRTSFLLATAISNRAAVRRPCCPERLTLCVLTDPISGGDFATGRTRVSSCEVL